MSENLNDLEMAKKRDHKIMITDEAINKVPRVQYKEIPETEYDMFNDKDIVELENLSGGRNAVYAEAEDSATDAYLYYKTGTDKDIPTIARYTTKTIQINIMTGKISLDLGLGEITEADTYLVTASTVYHCNTGIVDLGGKSGDYPQNGQDYVIIAQKKPLWLLKN